MTQNEKTYNSTHLIKEAAKLALGGDKDVIETHDFVAGCQYILKLLKEKNLLDVDIYIFIC